MTQPQSEGEQMKKAFAIAASVGALATVLALVAVQVAGASSHSTAAQPAGGPPQPPGQGACRLANGAKHVVYLQFDNTHFRRDNPNVASDLEQMPHLLDFLKSNGTLFTNDHTILISHTAGGITSSLTGLYPDRMGQTVSNSYDFFQNGTPNFHGSSFQYWTSPVNTPGDPLPNMITDGQKNTPAPWVPFTRDGCDVGGVGTANLELENNSTDVTNVFGSGSPESQESSTQKTTDFVGIAVHCSKSSTSLCHNDPNAHADPLPDEPGGYTGFDALFGAKYVDQAIEPNTAGNCVPDTEKAAGVAGGVNVTDADGNCGFPGFDGMEPHNTLGYVEAMQEAGVPVTYAYISDAHDSHTPNTANDSYTSAAMGPGEPAFKAQLAAYDKSFEDFFSNLAAHGIDKSNTLFVVTVDEGDHFAGGVADASGNFSHTTCTNLSACPSNQIGEVDTNMDAILPSGDQTPGFDIHFDDAPAFYVNGQPGRDDPAVRKLEQDVGDLTSLDPYVKNSAGQVQTVKMTDNLADPVELKALHQINADPNRTPTFVDFGNDDFFFQESNCNGVAECASPGFAWNHGDDQSVIGNTWVGFVGPGVAANGVDSTTWTDHTNVRPTILSLLGLKDDYVDDGHPLVQAMTPRATPPGLASHGPFQDIGALEQEDDLVNSPFGPFGTATLKSSTYALESTDDATYNSVEDQIQSLTAQRDALADRIRQELYDAAFDHGSINPIVAQQQIAQAKGLIAQAAALPSN
jgi:hypothetical protein